MWQDQKEIGWIELFKGRISPTWDTAQAYFYQEFLDIANNHNYSDFSWNIRMIKELTTMPLECGRIGVSACMGTMKKKPRD